MIKVIFIGSTKSSYEDQIKDYTKRLNSTYELSWIALPYSKLEGDAARKKESLEIQKKISKDDYVILLDERGKELDNYELNEKLLIKKNITIVIGGPYGVSEDFRKSCNFVWSLGKLVLPHEMVRLILSEQIYRSQCIANNHPYHHK